MWIVFTVFDKSADTYGAIHLAKKMGVGVRMFSDAVNQGPETLLRLHPDDFELRVIGSFNEDTGELEGQEPYTVVTARQVLANPDQRELE